MRLLNPLGLAWLGLMLPILALYLLRLRRREVTISSVMFWAQAVDDLQANAPFQRLRRNLLLYLQLLAVLLGALAVARPFITTAALGGKTVVAILDRSASMSAPAAGGTRFELGQAKIRALLAGLERGDRLMLLASDDRVEVLHPLSSDPRSLRAALSRAQVTARPTDPRDALRLAVSAVRGQEDPRVYWFSDGAMPGLEDLGVNLAAVELVRLGEPADNVGITALDARRRFGQTAVTEVLLTLSATGPSPGERVVEVEFRLDDRLLDLRQYRLTPGEPRPIILADLPAAGGLFEARLTGQDALAADDRAWLSLGERSRTEILLVGRGDLFLTKALAIDPRFQVATTRAEVFARMVRDRTLRPGSVAVFSGESPAGEIPLPALYLATVGDSAPVTGRGEIARPEVIDWAPQHPVTRFVEFDRLAIATARRVTAKPWARALVEAAGTPLVVAGEQQGRRSLYVGFDFLDSDFPLRPGFPIFIGNAIDWLAETDGRGGPPAVRAGEPVTLAFGSVEPTAEVLGPDGRRGEVRLESGRFNFAGTDQIGRYEVRSGGETRAFAVSLLNPDETDLTPRGELRVGRSRIVAPAPETTRPRELWRALVVLLLTLLLLEWWWYHRRG